MNALDYILDGVEAELALERELGIRLVECDRELLKPVAAPAAAVTARPIVPQAPARPPASPPVSDSQVFDFVFLYDKPLTASAYEMMTKIVLALGKTNKTAPVVFEGELPKAKAYIVLGSLALKKWLPDVKATPGQWISTAISPNVMVTYSPSYILRYAVVTAEVKEMKKKMWLAIKSVLQRIASS